ncbi:hypothetical protein A35E_00388 [secondary endosymbiont of Heteropsylla cubana]|uniref:DUF721 domain-containing protein n=1 Tax=secondary endosymbiont of Heteropsylla cubana TaxID=134287 RepID=J3YTB2_9ENTR|nr:DciA family protein [secondary endosymbiont of Heteropsylla cubana]AFP85683.1 hypothetical protein A35E_00388 [secondary endosymbiont of Heteropsylla cubana]
MRKSYPHMIDLLFNNPNKRNPNFLLTIPQRGILLLNINRVVHRLLPKQLALRCRVANFREGVLVLETANANWKMLLSYEKPQLFSSLKKQILPSLLSMEIRINPSLAKKQEWNAHNNDGTCPFKIKPKCLSKQSAASIRHVAACSEGKLKKILERLAALSVKI